MRDKEILRGWKEIERYLGISRPAILANAYPIRKGKTKNVFALKTELDEFLQNNEFFITKNLKDDRK